MITRRHLARYLAIGLGIGLFSASALPGPAVSIASISPLEGQTSPGATVTLTGSGFSSDLKVFFDGLECRSVILKSPSEAEVKTPYLRPGVHELEIRDSGLTTKTGVLFTATPSSVDSQFDQAESMEKMGDVQGSLLVLDKIIKDANDLQVRAYAFYRKSQIYLRLGDLNSWKFATDSIFLNSDEAGRAVQTSWRYRLSAAQSSYLLDTETPPDFDTRFADYLVKFDVTRNPEARFYRSILYVRAGDFVRAKTDSDAILKSNPSNASYKALAILVAASSGDKTAFKSARETDFSSDPRAASIFGEAAYYAGDIAAATRMWILAHQIDPTQALLAFRAAKKHIARNQNDAAKPLLAETAAMDPESAEGVEAQELLSKF
jgi:tetratricopeptide (TPR) repeat protein